MRHNRFILLHVKPLSYQSLWRGIAYAMLAVVFIASLLPTEHLPKGNDKIQHLVSYAVLAWWCFLVFQKFTIKLQVILAFKLIVFGAIIEILQGLSGYRYAEWYDLLANSIGIILGYFISVYITPNFLTATEFWIKKI